MLDRLMFSAACLALRFISQLGIIWCPLRPDLYESHLVTPAIPLTLACRCLQLQLPKR
jgi:hypothetical protein